jgi:beta-galactosidase
MAKKFDNDLTIGSYGWPIFGHPTRPRRLHGVPLENRVRVIDLRVQAAGDNGTRRNTRRCCTSRRGGNSRPGPTCGATLVWNMFHFASDGRNEGGQPGINDKGLVRRDRSVRKDASTGTRSTGHRRRRCTSPADAGRSAPLPADQPPVEQVLQLRQPRLRIWRRRPHGRQLYIRGWGGG